MEASVTASSVIGTLLDLVISKGHGKMALLVSYLWLGATTIVAFFIRLLAGQLFRPRRKEENNEHDSSTSPSARPREPPAKASKPKELEEEEEPHVFQFKFSFQIPEQSIKSRGVPAGEDGGSSMVTSISNYRFISDRGCRGFVEAPQAMTLRIQESYIDYDGSVRSPPETLDKELKSRFGLLTAVSSLDLRGDDIVSNEAIGNSAVALDRVLKSRLSVVKHSPHAKSDGGVSKEMDRELKIRLLSLKPPWGYESEEVGAAVCETQNMHQDNSTAAHVSEESEEIHDIKLLDEADVPGGGQLFVVPAGDYHGFSSDSESESKSDGYSVKDLSLDFDSDELFPEKDVEADVDRASSSGLDVEEDDRVEFEHEPKETQLSDSLDSAGGSKLSEGEDTESQGNINNCEEIKRGTLLNSITFSGIHDEAIDVGDLCAAGHELNQLHKEGTDESRAINYSGHTDEVSSITHVRLDTEHWMAGTMLSKGGQRRVDELGVEESESLESRETKGTELSNSCGSDKESVDLSIENQNMKNSNLFSQVISEGGTAASDSEPKHVTGMDTGDVADAVECSDELERGSEDEQDSAEPQPIENSEELSMGEMEELESLWENDDLLDQLRMHLKRARATGLPTILEESESPKPTEGLEPWKPGAPFQREDPMEGLHKFYKSYRERMRKFDVLNRQKMYAIGESSFLILFILLVTVRSYVQTTRENATSGFELSLFLILVALSMVRPRGFLQLKDPLKSVGTQKPIIPTIASVLSHNFWRRRSGADPSEKFVRELQSDIELVYVGQTCLSWELLRYQYETTRELLGSDPHDGHPYNQVAEEFQQFQVLVERFFENEPFQGPRIPNYAKNRCVFRRLLQVPVVREDCFKDKAEARRRRDDAMTGEQLVYIMEDSIRVFWDFVKSEKDGTPLMLKGLLGAQVELQDPTDSNFMADIQTNLRQKQKKLKDVLRSGNCIVKKFKKPKQGRPSQDDLFFSQVDLKLVSRVLRMTRITTDQLVWCHKKLSKISFVNRKLLREPSFLLFPC
ncbi:hypothetical protein Taro_037399 [Colocasia esculenta]|uniref:Uncharacterized protein n=1 Tax=Colocasia esculenta TaxID=4460 RepID=A0A843W9M7_COLES|nr:hypothetical protein [Colocasia esculenta]